MNIKIKHLFFFLEERTKGKWAISDYENYIYYILNRDLCFVYECLPSERKEDHYRNTRFSYEECFEFMERYIKHISDKDD